MRRWLLLALAALLAVWLALALVSRAEGAPYEASVVAGLLDSVEATVTAYCLTGTTYSGDPVGPGVVAHATLDMGTSVCIPGYGCGVIKDRGEGVPGEWFDVWIRDCEEATRWGVQRLRVRVVR